MYIVVGAGEKLYNHAFEKNAVMDQMDKAKVEKVVKLEGGQYGATEVSAEELAEIKAGVELCSEDVLYVKDENNLTAKIDADTLLPERC